MLDSYPSQDVLEVVKPESHADYLHDCEHSQKQHLRHLYGQTAKVVSSKPRIIIAEECDDDDELLLILTEASSPSESSLSSYMDNLASSAHGQEDMDISVTGSGIGHTNPQEHSPILTSSIQSSIDSLSSPTSITADGDDEAVENENTIKNDFVDHNSNFDLNATRHTKISSTFGLSNGNRNNILMSSSPSSFSSTSTASSSSSALKYQYIPRHSSSPSF